MKIKFTKSPTGRFKLGYGIGSIGDIADEIAHEVVLEGFGEEVDVSGEVIEKKAPIKKTIKKAK